MKNKTFIVIILSFVIFMVVMVSSFELGRRSKDCPPSSFPNLQLVPIDDGENLTLKKDTAKYRSQIRILKHKSDSLKNLLNKKNEATIILNDTFIPSVFREFASYYNEKYIFEP
jgi:hypothetical protein